MSEESSSNSSGQQAVVMRVDRGQLRSRIIERRGEDQGELRERLGASEPLVACVALSPRWHRPSSSKDGRGSCSVYTGTVGVGVRGRPRIKANRSS